MNRATPNQTILIFTFCAILAIFTTAGCGGGGGGGGTSGTTTVAALSLPDRIELTNVDDEETGGASFRSAGFSRGLYSDSGTDYSNQTRSTWVDDTDALDMINSVLGVCKDTAYSNFVNQGAYKALVKAVDDSEQGGSGNATTSTTTEQLQEIYVEVTRASNDDPMIVKIWLEVPNGPNDQAMLVRGHFTVNQGVSTEYPYGVMTAHFKGVALGSDGSEGAEMMNMALSVNASGGQVILENVEDCFSGSNYMYQRRVQVVANADVSQGNAYVAEKERDWDTGDYPTSWDEWEIAFNDQYFKESDGSTDTFYSKDSLKRRIYGYKLFDADTGDKVELSSGFPIETADGKHGYVGYYGLWAPHGITIGHGDTVTDMNGDSYTVFQSGGKLTKHVQASLQLSALDRVELSKWNCAGEICTDLVVAWESDSDTFITLGYRNQETGQIVYYAASHDDYHNPVTFSQWEGAWCEPLRAYLRLGTLYYDDSTGGSTTPTDASTLYYHTEQTVNPSTAADLTLYTWEFAMDTPITQSEVTSYDSDMNTYWSGSPTEKTFYFTAAEMMLTDTEGNDVTLGSGLTIPEGSNLQWGYHLGPLTTDHYYTDTSPYIWEAHEASVYYTWNSGSDDWNKLTTLIDGNGDYVGFDAPISFSYTHSTANDANDSADHDGKTFRIEYDGHSIHIPWDYDETTDEWEPQINIADGTPMGPTGSEYVVKATEEALIMTEISDPSVTFPTNTVGEPGLTYDATKTALVGDVPTTAELKVIKGVVQE